MVPRPSFDRAAAADPRDARVTITLLVTSIVLSGLRLQGADFDLLIPSWESMPREPWRLVTTGLLHGDWIHLAFNVYWTFKFGVLLEAMLGPVALALTTVVLLAGPIAAQWAFAGPCVGLSGVGFGYVGLLWALDRWHPDCRGVIERRLVEFFAAWFLICLALSRFGLWPVANVAHGVGALLGALLGWNLAATRGGRRARSAVLALALVLIGLFASVLRPVVNRSGWYERELFQRAYAAAEAGDHQRAAELYRALLARNEGLHGAWNNLGIAYRELGQFREAFEALRRAEELAEE